MQIFRKKIIYLHSDMSEENNTKSNYHRLSILDAYINYDLLASVRNNMEESLQKLSPAIDIKKLRVVHNVNDIERIIKNAEKELIFDDETESTHSIEEIEEILRNNDIFKYNINYF